MGLGFFWCVLLGGFFLVGGGGGVGGVEVVFLRFSIPVNPPRGEVYVVLGKEAISIQFFEGSFPSLRDEIGLGGKETHGLSLPIVLLPALPSPLASNPIELDSSSHSPPVLPAPSFFPPNPPPLTSFFFLGRSIAIYGVVAPDLNISS